MLRTQSDDRLVQLACEGHELAFEVLVRRYRRPLLLYSRQLLGPTARAEDAVQQGLFQAWMSLRRGTEVREARPWLYRIVRNAALAIRHANGNEHGLLSESLAARGTPESDVEQTTAVRALLADVAALPPMQRAALLQTAVQGRSHAQVATLLGLSDDAVRGLVYRARRALRAGATAITPLPLASWLAQVARTAPLGERLSALTAGAGGGGVLAALAKGGAVLITAGAIIAGGAAVDRTKRVQGPDKSIASGDHTLLAALVRGQLAAGDTTGRERAVVGATIGVRGRAGLGAERTRAPLIPTVPSGDPAPGGPGSAASLPASAQGSTGAVDTSAQGESSPAGGTHDGSTEAADGSAAQASASTSSDSAGTGPPGAPSESPDTATLASPPPDGAAEPAGGSDGAVSATEPSTEPPPAGSATATPPAS